MKVYKELGGGRLFLLSLTVTLTRLENFLWWDNSGLFHQLPFDHKYGVRRPTETNHRQPGSFQPLPDGTGRYERYESGCCYGNTVVTSRSDSHFSTMSRPGEVCWKLHEATRVFTHMPMNFKRQRQSSHSMLNYYNHCFDTPPLSFVHEIHQKEAQTLQPQE